MTQKTLFSDENLRKVCRYAWSAGEEVAAERLVLVKDGDTIINYFHDKESYLEWVAEWKAVWKRRSEEQRKLRIQLSKPHKTVPRVGLLQGQRVMNKMYLRTLLHARRYAKRISWQMKQEVLVG